MKFTIKLILHFFVTAFLLCTQLCLLCFTGITKAATVADSAHNSLPTITASGGSSTSCSYYGQDTFAGAELPASGYSSPTWLGYYTGVGWDSPPVTDSSTHLLSLSWSGGSNSSLNTPIPTGCSGTYQVIMFLQIQAANSNSAVTIYPCLQTSDSVTTIYGTCPPRASGSNSFVFNPQCNSGYYCGIQVFPMAAKIHLNAGQTVAAPSIYASGSQVAVTGGEVIVFLISTP